MRILHWIDSGGLYGAERVLLTLMERQRALGDEPVLGSMGLREEGEKPLEREARRRRLRVERVTVGRFPTPRAAWMLNDIAGRGGFDVVHTHGYKPNVLLAVLPRKRRHAPVVTTLHGWCSTAGWSRLRIYESVERWLLPRLEGSAFVAKSMLADPRVPAGRIARKAVVPNGIDWDPPEPPEPGDPIGAFCAAGPTIGSFGRFSPEKGFSRLVEAAALLHHRGKPVRLLLLGDGPERTRLETLVAHRGLSDSALLPGYVPSAERYLAGLRAYVLASSTEGMPLTILEGMFSGIPIIATRVGAVPEMLEEGRGGLLVDRSSPERLAAAIDEVLSDPSQAAARAAVARARALAEHGAGIMARRYADLYASVLR